MPQNINSIPILDLIVQMGVFRMRGGVRGPDGMPYYPRICLWVDERTGMVLHFEISEPAENYLPLVNNSFIKLVEQIPGVPRQIQMRDPQIASELKNRLLPVGIEVVVRESLPMLDEALNSLMDFKILPGGKPEPALLDQPGMSLDRLIAFAEAAKTFYEAAPWRQLTDDDLLEIESSLPAPEGTRFALILGAGGEAFGLSFLPKRKMHEDMRTGKGVPRGKLWTLFFDNLDALAFDDGETWERYNLPVASADAFPRFEQFSRSTRSAYPTAEQLTWAEGLLRAIAASTEDELDTGQWTKQVHTFAGPGTYHLSLPILLDQLAGKESIDPARMIQSGQMAAESMMFDLLRQLSEDGPPTPEKLGKLLHLKSPPAPKEPNTPAEKAQALICQARQSRGRREIQLVRQALAIDPNCGDALSIFAERSSNPTDALPFLRRAVEAEENKLGADFFHENAGHFWGLLPTRPYMRARRNLAMILLDLDRPGEAIPHLRDLLRLNPGDNQGNRYHLAQALLLTNQLDDLDALLNRAEYKDEFSCEWAFARTLLAFRRHGDSPEAQKARDQATEQNRFVIPLLTGEIPVPPVPPQLIQPGGETEAAACVFQIAHAWEQTPGAIEWLSKPLAKPANSKRRKKR